MPNIYVNNICIALSVPVIGVSPISCLQSSSNAELNPITILNARKTAKATDCVLLADFYGITLDELVGRDFKHSEQNIKITDSFNNNKGNINFKT